MQATLKAVLTYLRILFDCALEFLFSLYWDNHKEVIPDLEKRYSFLADSATALALKIKRKELKSEDLVEAFIRRIKQVNPIINAVAEDMYSAALEDAKEVDRRVAAGLSPLDLQKPFLGVPFTTKECQAIKGCLLTLGLVSRKSLRAEEDSEAIVRMKAAGAIPLATTNLPELLFWQETRNMVYGMTRNPHHTGRSPGGSSGGEAALTAVYGTPISLCSDIGGSTRMPAFYCGQFGHHPTPGTTNTKGILFRNGDEDSMLALGFISKHVEDLAPLVKVVAGDQAASMHLDKEVDVKNLKYFYLATSEDCLVSPIAPELRNAMKKVITRISEEVKNPNSLPQPYYHEGFNHMYSLWKHWMTREPEDFANLYNNRRGKANAIKEVVKKILGVSKHCMSAIVMLLELQFLPKVDKVWAESLTEDLKRDLFATLGEDGVLIMPSAPHPAPYHYSCFLRPFNWAYWGIVNVLKCPATQVPMGLGQKGLPLGLQVVAAPQRDALCLAVAKYLETEFGGAVMACKIK